MKKLKKRWGVTSNLQLILILLVFSINGTFVTWIAKPLTEFIGLTKETHPWLFWPVRIVLIFLLYQFTLPIVGFFLGQFDFFKKFSKKKFTRMGLKFLFKTT